MITPYDRSQWERVLDAFSEFLDKRRAYSKAKREHADNELKARQIACEQYSKEYRLMNGHIIGTGAYSRYALPMRHGAVRTDKQVNLTHHSNGQPILWRVEPLPVMTDNDKLYMAQLRLTA